MSKNYDGLAIFFESFSCDKNCPYCIAKDNVQFLNENENFAKLEFLLKLFSENNLHFDKFILSGNGETSLQSYETIEKIARIISKYQHLFTIRRFYTSGNLFFDDNKFNLVNKYFDQINIMVNSLDPVLDMRITGYDKAIWSSNNIKLAKNIKLDISLTKYLDIDNFINDLEDKIKKFPNIKKIKLKRLKYHGNETKQSKWIKENSLSEDDINKLNAKLSQKYSKYTNLKDSYFKINDDCNLVLNAAGRKNPTQWIFIKNEKVFNYYDEELELETILEGESL